MTELLLKFINHSLNNHVSLTTPVFSLVKSKKMIDLKTTTGFTLIYRILKKASKSDLNLDRFCYLLGQLFQIRDDYINLKCDDFHKLKGG